MFDDFFEQAPLTKFVLTSQALDVDLHRCPEQDEELVQWLTLTATGEGTFIGALADSETLTRRQTFQIDPAEVQQLFATISAAFRQDPPIPRTSTTGIWQLTLVNEAGVTLPFTGALGCCSATSEPNLSELIRTTVKIAKVIAFGEPRPADAISRLTLTYQDRRPPVAPFLRFICLLYPEKQLERLQTYSEQWQIDRPTATITQIQNFGADNKITRTYQLPEVVAVLLGDLEEHGTFAYTVGHPPASDVMADDAKTYQITVDYEKNPQRLLSGSFDRQGLPEDFADFAAELAELLGEYDQSAILDPRIYRRAKRRPDDLIFCSVIFRPGAESYYYLTDDEQIAVGDLVLVPTGAGQHETTVEVVAVDYFSAEEAPRPVAQTKWIIGKASAAD